MFETIHFPSKWKTPLGLNKSVWMWKNKIENIDLISVKEFLLEKEKELLKLPAEHVGISAISARSNQFNLFNFENEEIKKIKICVQNNVKDFCKELNIALQEFYIMCWYNVLREGEKISKHQHFTILNGEESFISGHLCIAANNTTTYYNSICDQPLTKIKNESGLLNFFPGYLHHFTDEHKGNDVRITIAMDIYWEKRFANPDFLKRQVVIPLF